MRLRKYLRLGASRADLICVMSSLKWAFAFASFQPALLAVKTFYNITAYSASTPRGREFINALRITVLWSYLLQQFYWIHSWCIKRCMVLSICLVCQLLQISLWTLLYFTNMLQLAWKHAQLQTLLNSLCCAIQRNLQVIILYFITPYVAPGMSLLRHYYSLS